MDEVTRILSDAESGDMQTAQDLLPLVYTELRRLAAYHLAKERPGQTLQATELVHEAWLRLVGEENRQWRNSRHFFCAAATAMRRILIDRARRKRAVKHGGLLLRVDLEGVTPAERVTPEVLLAVDEALKELAEEDADAARLVELRFFAGLGHQEAARTMGMTRRQADGLWVYARAWLRDAVERDLA